MRTGDQIGPYTLVSRLGKGSFGVVWLAERRTSLATTKAALKMPLDDEIDIEAIRQEADVWVQASGHPNVLPIIEANIYDDQIVIASEFAPDGSLDGWLRQHGGRAPSVEAAVEIVLGILAGLQHLHARDIIHRDLKPANIIFQGDTPRLADFGVSRILKTTNQSSTSAGTPSYMAPEAFDGERSEQTDVWSVGAIFYQLLSGRLPFAQEDMASLVGAIVLREFDPLPATIPAAIQDVVNRALTKDRTRRYASAAEMRADLKKAVDIGRRTEYISDEAPTVPNYRDLVIPGETVKIPDETVKFPPHRKERPVLHYVIAAVAAVVVLGLIGFGVTSLVSKNSAPTANTVAVTDETPTGFAGQWQGTWKSPKGSVYSADLSLSEPEDGKSIEGSIIWTLKESQIETNIPKIGQTGTEFVRGTYNPQTRLINMEGYKEVDPVEVISVDKYRLTLSEDGRSLSGPTFNGGKWDNSLALARVTGPAASDPNAIIPAEQMCPERAGYLVIGRGSPNKKVALRELMDRKTEGFNPCIVNTSKWSNLNAGWFITVYGIFADEKAATNMKKQLEVNKLTGLYIKQSGNRQE